MQKNRKFTLFVLLTALALSASAQKIAFPFGDIPRADLQMTTYKPDPDASAVILSDRGAATLVYAGNQFTIEFERNVRIKILNTDGFGFANIEIPYLAEDKLSRVKASTYNIINDSIVETPVNSKEFIKDNSSKYHKTLRIAFANVSVGSVIEYQYKHTTEYVYRFIPWEFQAEIPTRYSEFSAEYNDFFDYKAIVKGEAKSIQQFTSLKNTFVGSYRTGAKVHRWVGSNIPAFEREPYTKGIKDLSVRVEFELAGTNFPGGSYQVLTPSYKDLPKKVLDRSDFGEALKKTSFLDKVTNDVVSKCPNDELSKLKAIREFVANKILWDGRYRFSATDNLKKVYNRERGNSAEVNLILIAMLQKANLNVHPVILSTRANGSLHPFMAMIQSFNHVVASVKIGDKTYLVDATEPLLPFNVLPYQALNNQGRLINVANSNWVDLTNGEMNITTINFDVEIDSLGSIKGKVKKSYSGYDGFRVRRLVKLESKKGYKDLLMASNPSWEISDLTMENLDSLSKFVNEQFEFATTSSVEPTHSGLIFNPNLHISDFSNAFLNEERKYPIDFGCPELLTYSAVIRIPKGYEVDEMPKNMNLALPEKGGAFVFACAQVGNTITIQSRFSISQIRFEAKDYKTLREFFTQAARKQSELIVLKKI